LVELRLLEDIGSGHYPITIFFNIAPEINKNDKSDAPDQENMQEAGETR
jgi:hypothetical protein